MKKLHDMAFIVRLAHKNMWFKKRIFPLIGLSFIIILPSWNKFWEIYQLGGLIAAIGVLGIASIGVFVLFPLAILWVDLQKDPAYIERLAATLPQYYNK